MKRKQRHAGRTAASLPFFLLDMHIYLCLIFVIRLCVSLNLFSLLIYHFPPFIRFLLSTISISIFFFILFICLCIILHLFNLDSSYTYFKKTKFLFFFLTNICGMVWWHYVRRNELSTKITGEDRRELMELQYQVRHHLFIKYHLSSSLTSCVLFSSFLISTLVFLWHRVCFLFLCMFVPVTDWFK